MSRPVSEHTPPGGWVATGLIGVGTTALLIGGMMFAGQVAPPNYDFATQPLENITDYQWYLDDDDQFIAGMAFGSAEFAGNDGCNIFAGQVVTEDPHLYFGEYMQTQVYCFDEREQELAASFFPLLISGYTGAEVTGVISGTEAEPHLRITVDPPADTSELPEFLADLDTTVLDFTGIPNEGIPAAGEGNGNS